MMLELKRHPDLGGSTLESSLLNEAYEILSNPAKRASYDGELFRQFTGQDRSQAMQPMNPVFCPICKRALSRKPEAAEICMTCRTPLAFENLPVRPSNSRGLERTKSSEPVFIYPYWPKEPTKAKMIDFSPKGMRFICSEKLEPQAILKISCELFEAAGRITNISEETAYGMPYYTVGVCFLAVRFTESRGTFFSTSA